MTQDKLEIEDQLDLKELKVVLVIQEDLEAQVYRVYAVLWVDLALQASLVILVNVAFKAQMVNRASKVHRVFKDFLARWDSKEKKDFRYLINL